MKNVLKRIEEHWFQPATPYGLAVMRIFIGGFALNYVWDKYNLLTTPGDPDDFAPVGLANLLSQPPIQYDLLVFFGVTCLCGVAFITGLRYRYSGPLFAACFLFMMCYRNSWGMIYHSRNLLVFHLIILGAARSADVWSIDAWFRKWRGTTNGTPVAMQSHWKYGWPIQLACMTTACIYCLAGVAKVFGELGWSWAGGAALRDQVAINALRKHVLEGEGSPIAAMLYEHVWLFTVLGIATLIFEIGAPAFMWNRRAAQFWALNAFAMHWSIYFIMDIEFNYQLTGLAFISFFVTDPKPATVKSIFQLSKSRQTASNPQLTSSGCGVLT